MVFHHISSPTPRSSRSGEMLDTSLRGRGDGGEGGMHGWLGGQDLEWLSVMAFDVGLEEYILVGGRDRDRASKEA